MADVKWIKITTDIFDDEKILLIESLPDSYAIITVWFKLLCLAGKQNNSGVFMMGRIAYTDKMLATIFRMKESTVALALKTFEQFGMIEIVDGVITIPNWGKHQSLEQIEARREYQRAYQKEYRQRQKLLAQKEDENEKHLRKHLREQNVNSLEEELEGDLEKEKNKEIKRTDYQQIADLYNETCVSFPCLKSLSDSRKKAIKARLNTYSVDDFKSLFEKAEASDFLKGKNDRNWSATFDWLIKDSNMAKVLEGQYANKGRKEMVPSWANKPNRFHNYQQRDTDYDKLTADNDPLMAQAIKTAANDKETRERAEALKRQLRG